MATTLQLRRGTAAEAAAFTGAQGELFIDTENNTAYLHDGTTAGGHAVGGSSSSSSVSSISTVTPDVNEVALSGIPDINPESGTWTASPAVSSNPENGAITITAGGYMSTTVTLTAGITYTISIEPEPFYYATPIVQIGQGTLDTITTNSVNPETNLPITGEYTPTATGEYTLQLSVDESSLDVAGFTTVEMSYSAAGSEITVAFGQEDNTKFLAGDGTYKLVETLGYTSPTTNQTFTFTGTNAFAVRRSSLEEIVFFFYAPDDGLLTPFANTLVNGTIITITDATPRTFKAEIVDIDATGVQIAAYTRIPFTALNIITNDFPAGEDANLSGDVIVTYTPSGTIPLGQGDGKKVLTDNGTYVELPGGISTTVTSDTTTTTNAEAGKSYYFMMDSMSIGATYIFNLPEGAIANDGTTIDIIPVGFDGSTTLSIRNNGDTDGTLNLDILIEAHHIRIIKVINAWKVIDLTDGAVLGNVGNFGA